MSVDNKPKFKILSAQKWNNYFPLQVVFEWEKILSEICNIDLDTESQIHINKETRLKRIAQKFIRNSFLKNVIDSSFNYLKSSKTVDYYISFLLYPSPVTNHYIYQSNVIPIILDCFAEVVDQVPILFKKNPLVFVTNLEVFQKLMDSDLSGRIHYIPLSISDKYYTDTIPAKTIDVLQMGRKNPVLHNWMLQFVKDHPDVEYVYSAKFNDMHGYTSTRNGWIGSLDKRPQFMDFLGKAKISLLSAPGVDGGENRTVGYNPVTPRFYESAVKYCYMIGRYPDGADFLYNNISSVCKRPKDYDEFEKTIMEMLSNPFNKKNNYKPFIEQHLTSTIALLIKKKISDLKITNNNSY